MVACDRGERVLHVRSIVPRTEAETVDAQLRSLARREAEGRVVLGRIAEVFLRREAHCTLGFARVSDYARERLGMSASQLYEYGRVARELRRLPLIARAFNRGDLGWTKVRELAGAASFETQRGWLAVARTYTADGLKLAVKRIKQEARQSRSLDTNALWAYAHAARNGEARRVVGAEQPGDIAQLLDDDEIDGEPSALFRIRCPRRVRSLWFRVRTLARKVAGGEISDWQTAEAIAAECISTTGWPSGDAADGRSAGAVEAVCADVGVPTSVAGATDDRLDDQPFVEAGTRALTGIGHTDELDANRRQPADSGHDGDPDVLHNLTDDLMITSAHDLDARMRAILAALARVDWELGSVLRRFFDLRLHHELGYASEGSYVRNRLGMCSRKARALVALERAGVRTSRALTEAYRDGQLAWYRCLMLLPIVSESNVDVWLERAERITARRLKDEVEWALEVQASSTVPVAVMPPPMGDSLARHPCPTCGAEHDCSGHEDAGEGPRKIRGHADRCGGGDSRARCCGDDPLADVELRIRGPVSVVALVHAAIKASLRPGEPSWRGFERVMMHAKTFWESAPRHRDPVFERDGWRCAAPACTSRRNLQDHHIVFRSRGGGNARENRITLCAWHHLRGIHGARVRLSGRAGDVLHWELGLRRDGSPLMQARGDEYVDEGVSDEGRSEVLLECDCACAADRNAA